MTTAKITNLTKNITPVTVDVADSFFLKLIGLMFRKTLHPHEGLLLSEKYESIINSSIHMLFMQFDICVIWIDKSFYVVDKKYARKWRPAYFPKKAAKYVLELNATQINNYTIGDRLEIQYSN